MIWGCLAGGWTQFGTLLVWRWPLGYYMLPVALWFCVSLPLLMANLLDSSGIGAASRGRGRGWMMAILAFIFISRAYSLPYIHFIAHAQRNFDRQEDAIQDKVIEMSPVNKRVVDLERIWFTEPPLQRTRLFTEKGRADIKWVGGGELFYGYTEDLRRLYRNAAPPDLTLQPLGSGDLVLMKGATYPFNITLRGVGCSKTNLPDFNVKEEQAEKATGTQLREVFRLENRSRVLTPWTFKPRELVFVSVLYKVQEEKPLS